MLVFLWVMFLVISFSMLAFPDWPGTQGSDRAASSHVQEGTDHEQGGGDAEATKAKSTGR